MEPVGTSLYTGIHIPFLSLGVSTPCIQLIVRVMIIVEVGLTLGSQNEKVVVTLRNELIQLIGCHV